MIPESAALPTVRVYLQRQVTVVIKGNQSTRKFSIGEGILRPIPPSASPPPRSPHWEHGLSTLDYEGEVCPNPDTTVGQFGMSRLQVRVRPFHPMCFDLSIDWCRVLI